MLARVFRSTELSVPNHDSAFLRKIEVDAQDSLERLATTPLMLDGVQRLLDRSAKALRVLWLDEFQDPEAFSAIHGDFQRNHVLISVARRGRARIGVRVIDWELAGWGLPEYDLAKLLAYEDATQSSRVLETYATSTQRPAAEVNRRFQWCSLVHSLSYVRSLERRSRLDDGGRALRQPGSGRGRAAPVARRARQRSRCSPRASGNRAWWGRPDAILARTDVPIATRGDSA